AHEAQAGKILRKVGVELADIEFFRFPTNRGWTRDFGPIFVRRGGGLAVARFRFNAWAKYDDYKKDAQIAERAARRLKLPVIYANFYIANAAVLVPTFNDPKDRVALGILAELFADRPVIGIHAVDLVWGLGTLHCLTQQEPAVTP